MKPMVFNFKDLNNLDHLPLGAVVIVMMPVEHKWIKMKDGWYNLNPEVTGGVWKLEFKTPITSRLNKFINRVKSIFK